MKTRNDFVSNSSSSSFIVDKNEHGAWFTQLINIIRGIQNEHISNIYIWFDNQVDALNLFWHLKTSIQNYKCDDWFSIGCSRTLVDSETIKDEITLSFHTANLINIIRLKEEFMKHITCIRVDLEYDLGAIEERIHKQLKDTGLEFEWRR